MMYVHLREQGRKFPAVPHWRLTVGREAEFQPAENQPGNSVLLSMDRNSTNAGLLRPCCTPAPRGVLGQFKVMAPTVEGIQRPVRAGHGNVSCWEERYPLMV